MVQTRVQFWRFSLSMNPARHGGIRLRPNGGLIQCFGRAPTGQLQASPGQSPGSSIAQRKSPEGATQNPAQIPLIQATTHRRMSNHAMATHCKLVRPFRAFSGMHDLPKALPLAAIRMPLWGVKDGTATLSRSPMDHRGSWSKLASNFLEVTLPMNHAC